jgi:hypothetical protein
LTRKENERCICLHNSASPHASLETTEAISRRMLADNAHVSKVTCCKSIEKDADYEYKEK